MSPKAPRLYLAPCHGANKCTTHWKKYLPVFLSIFMGLSLSIALFQKARDGEWRELEDEFEHAANNPASVIVSSIRRKLQALGSVRSFYHSSQNIDREKFAEFVTPYITNPECNHTVQWMPLVRQSERESFEEDIQAGGFHGFNITEWTTDGRIVSASVRDMYFPVKYSEPCAENPLALGYDTGSNPVLLKAIEQARDTGLVVASEKVRLLNLVEQEYGVYVILPVYQTGSIPDTIAQRRDKLEGFVAGVFHINELVESAISQRHPQPVEIHVLDSSPSGGTSLLYSHVGHHDEADDADLAKFKHGRYANMHFEKNLTIGGRKWRIVCNAGEGFVSTHRLLQPWLILICGILVTLVVTAYFLTGIGRMVRIERLVSERTEQLSETNESLQREMAERAKTNQEKDRLLDLLSNSNAKLTRLNEKLATSNKELEDFAYVASHDLQEPLRKVTAFGDRLKAGYSDVLDETGRDYVERMQNAARRMSILINDLLTYSRVSSKAQPFAEVDLEETVREVLEDLEVHIEELNATVQVGPLPCVQADAIQMRQLMQNLISNALKFHKSDTPPAVKIYSRPLDEDATEATASGSAVEIVVEDNGIGFDEKHADQIFRMFQRLHGRSEYEGTGVGLAVCRKIAERHGIAITAKGTAGVGARFALTFASGSVLSQSTVTNCKGLRNV